MSKELFVSSTPHETKVAIVEEDQLSEIYFERENEYTLAGSIYKGKVTRVLPGMQSAFVEIGLERDAFLYVSDFIESQEAEKSDIEPMEGPPPGPETAAEADEDSDSEPMAGPTAGPETGGEASGEESLDLPGERRGRRDRRHGRGPSPAPRAEAIQSAPEPDPVVISGGLDEDEEEVEGTPAAAQGTTAEGPSGDRGNED